MNSTFDPLGSSAPLVVYIDYKSPYAFAAKDVTYALAAELNVEIDWRAVTLDIPSYLGSARLTESGSVAVSDRTPKQWSGVRYAYKDARRYASAYGQRLRGTTKIWDTTLIHIAMLWVKRAGQAPLRSFTDYVFARFWVRDLDVEDMNVVLECIELAGVTSHGFEAWAVGRGRIEHDSQQAAIFAAGIFGVPSYVVQDQTFFGREHLPQVRALLQSGEPADMDVANPLPTRESLSGSADDGAAHAIFGRIAAAAAAGNLALTVAIDLGCAQSYLAVERLRELAQAWPQLRVDWLPLARSKHKSHTGTDRGSRHRAMRAEYRIQDLCRYARWRGLVGVTPESVTNPETSELAAMAMLWVRAQVPERLAEFVYALFVSYWRDATSLTAQDQMDALLGELGFDAADFAVFRAGAGATSVSAAKDWLNERGLSEPFGFIALDTAFAGRAHLALIDWAFAPG